MEGRHGRLPPRRLDLGGLNVGDDIKAADQQSEEEHRDEKDRHAAGEQRQGQDERDRESGRRRSACASRLARRSIPRAASRSTAPGAMVSNASPRTAGIDPQPRLDRVGYGLPRSPARRRSGRRRPRRRCATRTRFDAGEWRRRESEIHGRLRDRSLCGDIGGQADRLQDMSLASFVALVHNCRIARRMHPLLRPVFLCISLGTA